MALLIQNGEIVTDAGRQVADVHCEDEQITRIGRDLAVPPGTTVIDATGKYVFPGFVDPHVHVYLPFAGTQTRDTYETASRAALLGGTTCFIDFVNPERDQEPLECLETWNARSRGKSACDFTYHMTVSRFDAGIESQLREVVARGITSFKIYLAYKGIVGLENSELEPVLRLARELGVIVPTHCENAEMIDQRQRELIAEGKTGPEWHYWSRPPVVEADGVRRLMMCAERTGAHVYVVHTTCREALAEAEAGRQRGVDVHVETCIQHLLLDKSYAERPGFEGAKYVMSPPLRDKADQDALWAGLREGRVNTVATDHAPTNFEGQKSMGKGDFTKIPGGVPGIEHRVPLLFSRGVGQNRLSLEQFVRIASTEPARLFGLYPRKGTIAIGSDADLVVFDPDRETTLSAKTHAMNVDYNAYEGWTVKGWPKTVTVRGQLAVHDGEFVGEMGRGEFIAREPICV
ncbi:MAG: dihydropyrimidinase [Kiritimatiellia bacterium]|jgi:dihydropyrimidinase|nr:dihydropyrimidinase [Kiritimatiellia bacterium]MDP6631754.1 dihydropyrimidinase [Kiritimatiellia bacterium]MDP6810492.1 dihydropyrimidinase [Kiritimatiellia bacterium]MDP7024990.1 dihydropyrimidinase [Kiritimatiellia bacterium]